MRLILAGVNIFAALLHETILAVSLLSLPVLAIATVVGTLTAVVQAATSVQEQSIGVLPKIAAVGGAMVLGAPAGTALIERLFHEAVAAIPAIVASLPQ